MDAINVILTVILRLPISAISKSMALGKDSIFRSLYALPLHALIHIVFGGLLYYAFPYILVFLGMSFFTNWMAAVEKATISTHLKFWKDALAQSMMVSIAMLIMGIGATISYYTDGQNEYWGACFVAPLILAFVYIVTERRTSPEFVLTQMPFYEPGG